MQIAFFNGLKSKEYDIFKIELSLLPRRLFKSRNRIAISYIAEKF
jgi:hypothetical protein